MPSFASPSLLGIVVSLKVDSPTVAWVSLIVSASVVLAGATAALAASQKKKGLRLAGLAKRCEHQVASCAGTRSHQQSSSTNSASQSGPELLRGSSFSLVGNSEPVQNLRATEDRMQWFETTVSDIFELRCGIFCGEVGGEQLPSWKPGAFQSALRSLRAVAQDVKWPDAGTLYEPLDDAAMTLRLMATDLDVKRATDLLQSYKALRSVQFGGVVPTSSWLKSGVFFAPCEDVLGRPIVFFRLRYHKLSDIEQFRQGYRAAMDAVKAHSLQKRRIEGFSATNPLEQYVLILDVQGAGMRNADWDAFKCTIHESANHYPNLVFQIYVINVNMTVRSVWSAASKLVHPRTRRKVLMIGPKDVNVCMQKLIPTEKLPPQYGGTGKEWRLPTEAQTLEELVGKLFADVYHQAGIVTNEGRLSAGSDGRAEGSKADRHPRMLKAKEAGKDHSKASSCGCWQGISSFFRSAHAHSTRLQSGSLQNVD